MSKTDKSINDLVNSFKERVKKATTAAKMKKYAEEMRLDIIRRTRFLGRGIDEYGRSYKMPPLKDSTIDYRENYEQNLHPETKPQKSNLTATGKLLDSLKSDGGQGFLVIDVEDKRSGKSLSGGKDNGSNIDIIDAQEKAGRVWYRISKAQVNKLNKVIRKEILKDQ